MRYQFKDRALITVVALLSLSALVGRGWPQENKRSASPSNSTIAKGASVGPESNELGTKERVEQLKVLLEHEKESNALTVSAYEPKITGWLDDLDIPPEPILRQLPGVVGVDVAIPVEQPQHRRNPDQRRKARLGRPD